MGSNPLYAGKVDHGFDKVSAADLWRRLTPLVRKTQAFAKRIAHKGIWTEPKLLAEIEYRARSAEAKVRHPIFKGLRESLGDTRRLLRDYHVPAKLTVRHRRVPTDHRRTGQVNIRDAHQSIEQDRFPKVRPPRQGNGVLVAATHGADRRWPRIERLKIVTDFTAISPFNIV